MQTFRKIVVFVLCLIPLGVLIARVALNDFGPDPAQELAKATGEWALRFLVLVLAITPLRQLSGIVEVVRFRRMMGLYAWFYASVHLMTWMTFLLAFRWGAIFEELVERPFITVGFASYVILFALGVTSPKAMVRKLGRNWKRLHKSVYVAAILALVHLLWILRTDVGEFALYAGIVAVLFAYRFQRYLAAKKA